MTKIIDSAKQFLRQNINTCPFNTYFDTEANKWNKRPIVSTTAPFFNTLIVESEIEKYFAGANSIALACGKISNNLVVIDIENKNGKANEIITNFKATFNSFLNEYKFPIVRTRSGGYHVYFRTKSYNDSLNKSSVLAKYFSSEHDKYYILVETRGEGSFCNTVPSDGYKLEANDIFNIPTINDNLVYDIFYFFASYNELVIEDDKNTNVIDSYNNTEGSKNQIKNLLVAKGWRITGTKYKNDTEYFELTRPGKKDGVSATFLYPNSHFESAGLFLFSDNCSPFPRSGYYSLFDCLKYLQFNDDVNKAVSVLAQSGHGSIEDHDTLDSQIRTFIFAGTSENDIFIAIKEAFPRYETEIIKQRIDTLMKIYKKEFGITQKKNDPFLIMEYVLKKKEKLWVSKYGSIVMKGDKQVENLSYYWAVMKKDYKVKVSEGEFFSLIKSGKILQIKDPIQIFFTGLTPYDPENEPSYILKFARKVTVNEHINGLQIWFEKMLEKHLIRSIRQFFENKPNRFFFVFQGQENTKKTSYIRHISTFLPPLYYSEDRFKNITVDVKHKACRCFFHNIEEFDGIRNIDDLKAIASESSFNDRLPHHKEITTQKRIANYFGTVNPRFFLPSNQENTRFIVIPIEKINGDYSFEWQPGANNIDASDIMREALYLYNRAVSIGSAEVHRICELTEEEFKMQMLNNEYFTNSFSIESVIRKTFYANSELTENEGLRFTLDEVYQLIMNNESIHYTNKTDDKISVLGLAKKLKEMGYVKQPRTSYTNYKGQKVRSEHYILMLKDRNTMLNN